MLPNHCGKAVDAVFVKLCVINGQFVEKKSDIQTNMHDPCNAIAWKWQC